MYKHLSLWPIANNNYSVKQLSEYLTDNKIVLFMQFSFYRKIWHSHKKCLSSETAISNVVTGVFEAQTNRRESGVLACNFLGHSVWRQGNLSPIYMLCP